MYQHYTKENFIIGKSNIKAWEVCEAALSNSKAQQNPTILYGMTGSGKTHLAHIAISQANDAVQLSAMDFIDGLVTALSNQAEDEFRHRLINYDVLAIDDLQHFVGRNVCQDEICLILDARLAQGKQTVITSIEHPKSLTWNNKQLESRLLAGLTIKLELADEDMQKQLLAKRLEKANVAVTSEEIVNAVKSTNGNGWLIEGVAKQIVDNYGYKNA